MIETFKEFSFEAARSLPPHETLQRHVFRICLHMRGAADPAYGWPVNLNEVDRIVQPVLHILNNHHLNEIDGLSLPSTENIARWIWDRLSDPLPSLTRVVLTRGRDGAREGCVYIGRT